MKLSVEFLLVSSMDRDGWVCDTLNVWKKEKERERDKEENNNRKHFSASLKQWG